jgi:hypothetical protein
MKRTLRAGWRWMFTMLMCSLILVSLSPTAQARVSIEFNPDGDLVFTTVDTTRTPSSMYKTVGWIVRQERHCEDPRLEVWNQQCDPFWGGGERVIFRDFVTGEPVIERSRKYTTYTIPKAEVDKQFAESGFGQLMEGKELYFSPIFKLYAKDEHGNEVPLAGEYMSLADVISAQEWRSPSVFRQFYDIPVRFTSSNPLYLHYLGKDGQPLKEPKLIGHFPAGAYPGRIVLDRVLHHNGTQLDLRSSWIERISEPEPRPRRFEVDSSINVRNITVGFGGNNVVAVYDADGARVDARFIDESGNTIQPDVYVGNYKYGAEAEYAFPKTLFKDSVLYDLVKTYHTTRGEGAEPQYIQTSVNMDRRKLKVSPDGNLLWAMYRARSELAVTVDLTVNVPQHIPSTQTNVSGTLDAIFNGNTPLEKYEIIELKNATLLNPSQLSGTFSGERSGSFSLAFNASTTGASTTVSAKVRVYGDGAVPGEDGDSKTILKYSNGGVTSLDTSHQTVIQAAERDHMPFDVLQGIPSSEALYANVTEAKEYLHDFSYTAATGTRSYYVTVRKSYRPYWYVEHEDTYECKNDKGEVSECTSSWTETVYGSESEYSRTYEIVRPFTYYVVDKLAIYGIDQAELNNDALPGGQVILEPQGYTPPWADVWHSLSESDHVTDAIVMDDDVDLGSSDYYEGSMSGEDFYSGFESTAESQVGKVHVKNDRFIFKDTTTVMNDSWTPETAPTPGAIPEPGIIGRDVLYETGLVIDGTQANGIYSSTGVLRYELDTSSEVNSTAGELDFPLGPNSVTVHTPVVNDSEIPLDINQGFDQRMAPDLTKPALILDRPFTLNFDETAVHLPFPGYSELGAEKDYKKYAMQKRVQFPFGVYDTSNTYHPEDTWIDIPVGTPSMDFRMPTWIDEGDYQIITEAWAMNGEAPLDSVRCQELLNGDRSNTCAYRVLDVGVSGRIHSFRVTDIGDFRFQNVFRVPGSNVHSGKAYAAGTNDPNGTAISPAIDSKSVLPIRHGSHPQQPDTITHNGYPILFDFKTIGNYWDIGEGVRVDPTFWFVSKDGSARQEVDLYYNASGANSKLIRVGSTEDVGLYTRSYVLPDAKRGIPEVDLRNTAEFEFHELQSAETDWNKFYRQYTERKTSFAYGYQDEVLSYKSRTLVGLPDVLPPEVERERALRSVQHWYGEYHVPINPYILPKGTDIMNVANSHGGILTGRENEFLKNGYILVNFKIFILRNHDENTRLLGYDAPESNMWAIEGQVTSDTDASGNTFLYLSGDIILFESDFSASNDFQASGN